MIKTLHNLGDILEKGGADRSPIDKLVEDIEEAAKVNGTVKLNIFDDAVPHEDFHQISFLSAKDNLQLRNRIKNFDVFHKTSKEIIDKAFNFFFSRYGYKRIKDRAVIVEEIAAYIGTGEYAKLGLTEDEAGRYLYRWFKAYEEQNGDGSLDDFEKLFNQFERTIEAVKKVKDEQTTQENSKTQRDSIQRSKPVEEDRAGKGRGISKNIQDE